jgi:GDP-L-fucose synthase
VHAISVIPVNLYGPRDNFDPFSSHVIPALIRKCVEARNSEAPSIKVWGSGEASREFLYVEDCAEAIVAATERYDGPEPVNIGNGLEIKISALVEAVAYVVGFHGIVEYDNSKPDGQPRRCLDTAKAKELFGFLAKTDLISGLRRTVEWYENSCSHK